MSFSTALSGLNAATADLNVKSNNIANVNTVGFKNSRAEFGDVFAVSAFGTTSQTAIGNGVLLQNVAQQFSQGNLEFTDNSLDMAISGEGFFALAPELDSGEVVYTRAGEFGVDNAGYIISNEGYYLRAFEVDPDTGEVTATDMNSTGPIQLPASVGEAEATDSLNIITNLSSTETGLDDGAGNMLAIDPANSTTFHYSTAATVYDSLGNEHIITTYYQKIDAAADDGTGSAVGDNQWQMAVYVDGGDVKGGVAGTPYALESSARISFNADGTLNFVDANILTAAADAITLTFTDNTGAGTDWVSGAAAQTITLTLTGSTQNSAASSVGGLTVNGFPTGRLTGVDISEDGLIRATYSNGQAVPIGKIVLGTFANAQALNKVGNTSWTETTDSGPVIAGEAATGSFGQIQAGALETSNVDLTSELVGLITAQRNFQANSKAIETNNAITQTIINLR